MTATHLSPIGAVLRGMLAAAAGTVAMDLLWFARYKRGGGASSFAAWEFSAGLTDWEKAPVPAKVGKRLYEGFLQRELPASQAALTSNVMHWGYGTSWGVLFGIMAGSTFWARMRAGLLFGPAVWAAAYVVLPPTKLYKPIWEYDARTLWDDLSAHLVYGMATAATFGLLARS